MKKISQALLLISLFIFSGIALTGGAYHGGYTSYYDNGEKCDQISIPEPSILGLLGIGLIVIRVSRKFQK